jgi:ABC-type polysaccharide transport system permease subunit
MAFIVLGILSGLVVGICLSEVARKAMQKFYQTSILLPQLISFVIVSYIVYALLSNETGLITKALGASAPNFYSDKTWWPFILILSTSGNSWDTTELSSFRLSSGLIMAFTKRQELTAPRGGR